MHIETHKTHAILPGESLFSILDTYLPTLEERDVLVITSKIVSLCEGAVVKNDGVLCKKQLIRKSADAFLDLDDFGKHDIQLTIKNHIIIPSAGIDESNGNGYFILYPKNPQASAKAIWEYLRKRDNLDCLGVIVSDSHSTPLRRGVIGIGISWCGLSPLISYIGKPDCFQSALKMTKVNVIDSLTAAAVYCMGEGNEQTPLAVVKGAKKVEFQDHPPTEEELKEFLVPMEEDLYAPLLMHPKWSYSSGSKN